MTDFERFIQENGLKKKDIAVFLGVSNAFITQLCAGLRSLSDSKLALIKANEYGWDTSMFNHPSVTAKATNNSSANVTIGSHNNYAPAPVKTEAAAPSNTIPLIPIDAIAGPIAEYTSTGIMASQCERIVSPIAGATCAIRVSGDSMASEYNNGDICILKRINPSIFVEWGKVYVLDTENGAVLKEVRKCDDDGMVSCVSLNPNPKYRPFEIGMENIYGWYRVLMVMAMK